MPQRTKRRCGVLLGGSARPFYIGPKPYAELLAHLDLPRTNNDPEGKLARARLRHMIRQQVSPTDIAAARSGRTLGAAKRSGQAVQTSQVVIGLAAGFGYEWNDLESRWKQA